MKRSPLRRRARLRNKKPMNRGKGVNPVNRKRLAKRREAEFGISSGYRKHVIETPCAACGSYDSEVGSQPAHVGKTRGAGAKADRVLSLCWECHEWEGSRRNQFNAFFKARHGVTPEEMAMYRFEEFHRRTE